MSTETVSKRNPSHGRLGPFRRGAAVLVLALAMTGAAASMMSSPAGAASYPVTTTSVGCSQPWGTGTVVRGLDSVPAEGTTIAMYLYKYVWTGSTWAMQYQYQMDWARKNNNSGWDQNGVFKGGGLVLGAYGGTGYYRVLFSYWLPNGSFAGSGWSSNSCYFR